MKMNKKSAMMVSLAIGLILFTGTAWAEITSKSGYEQLKDSAKYTALQCTEKLNSYTVQMSYTLKNNDIIIQSYEGLNKYDLTKSARENVNKTVAKGIESQSYYYSDKNTIINHGNNSNDDTYYVNEDINSDNQPFIQNPFKEKQAEDVEKIADALVGNLKDYVVVNDNTDGTKELSGSLTEGQIPALINAVTSYELKNRFSQTYQSARLGIDNTTPKLTKDIYVKDVKGTMKLNKDGLIQNVLVTAVLSGKDDKDVEHNFTFEALIKITDVNKTIVTKPDLTGKKVQTYKNQNGKENLNNPEKFIGKYKNDVVIEKDGKFQKIGEKTLEITSIDNKHIVATYREEFKKGFEEYATGLNGMTFDASFETPYSTRFKNTDSTGKSYEGWINLNPNGAHIYLDIAHGQRSSNNDSSYNRVFD